jgi:hypothetical protein
MGVPIVGVPIVGHNSLDRLKKNLAGFIRAECTVSCSVRVLLSQMTAGILLRHKYLETQAQALACGMSPLLSVFFKFS